MDFAASVVIFSTALLVVLFTWAYTVQQNQQQITMNQMDNAVMDASDSLIRHAGSPNGWNQTNVNSIGLASSENVLDEAKVAAFLAIDDSTAKKLLGIGNYDYYFEVRYDNGSLAYTPGGQAIQKGIYPTNASIVVPAQRHVLYLDRIARLKLVVWS